MRPEPWDRVEHKLRCLKKIGQADIDDARRFVLTTVVETYVKLKSGEAERYAAEFQRETNREVRKMVITWEEALAARAAESKAEGEILGRLETLRRNILLLLQQRFGRRGEDVESRLLRIDDPQKLDELFEKALAARSLDELGLAS